MALTWLTALKVIPWGDVLEHAPKVLGAARKLLERQRDRGSPAAAPVVVDDAPGTAQPSLATLNARLFLAQQQIEELIATQVQLTQTVAELAEQNARLVSGFELMRQRSRWVMAALLVLAIGLGLLAWRSTHMA